MARPFLKWAGGKAKLAPAILAAAPPAFGRYFEPFVGAGAVFFAMAAEKATPAVLNDANQELIETFGVLRDSPARLLTELAALAAPYLAAEQSERRERYYAARASTPGSPEARAARFIFLNKTCYNGLFRVNSRGGFNVPHGRYKNPRLLDEELLGDCSRALQRADLRAEDFASVCAEAGPGDFVYLDPPYHPLSSTANFTGYTRADFGRADQLRLREAFEDLTKRGVAAMLSNSDHEFVAQLYGASRFGVNTVTMSRAINSRATARQPIRELLIDNFARVGLRSRVESGG
jgi:DNA adenine methylase